MSSLILLAIYLSVAFAVVAFAGTQRLSDTAGEEEFVFAHIAGPAAPNLPRPWSGSPTRAMRA